MSTANIVPNNDHVATVEVTPENAQSVDLSALKDAAFAPAPEQPVEAPKPPEPVRGDGYTITRTDAGLEVKLDSEYGGETFKGKDFEEVAPQILKAKIDANKYVKTLKAQAAEAPQRDPDTGRFAPKQPTAPELTEEQVDTTYWQIFNDKGKRAADMYYAQTRPDAVADSFAVSMGFKDAGELRQAWGQVQNTSQAAQDATIAATFHAQNPDFPVSEDNATKLLEYATENNLNPKNPAHLRLAHIGCLADGKYKVLTQEEISQQFVQQQQPPQSKRPTPPPVLTTTHQATVSAGDPWKMDIEELKKQAGI